MFSEQRPSSSVARKEALRKAEAASTPAPVAASSSPSLLDQLRVKLGVK